MANKIKECQGCPYNIPKTRGGHGRICNGLTQELFSRCPEWRISEIIKATDEAYSRNKTYHHIRG